ncbi:Fic family protein [Sphingobium sp. JS3065]|uniref:Fic family protein n=1 Tax=Sphingobium sp. JS3065 TaxID=2970925 RepID=UPI002263DC74|nr:Fic family protein [Sphingobium sp. JS3065]UZW54520.1 Fic family protein [Sphingobium sp. JS3065]
MIGQSMNSEAPDTIEPARIDAPDGELPDLIAEVAAKGEALGQKLHPRTAENLAGLVRIMNTYYSNLIEGHNTRPRDIERALARIDEEDEKRDLLIEAVAHVRLQARIDALASAGCLPDPAAPDFLRQLHHDFYEGATKEMLAIKGRGRSFQMIPGEWRKGEEQDVEIGRHLPPPSDRVPDFMNYFYRRFAFEPTDNLLLAVGPGKGKRILAMATAHHRFNYIHPFPDGNGRVSRLMSHAMAHKAGIGARGLWSISRGLARGLSDGPEGRLEYKQHMAWADEQRQGDRDGRGNLSLKGLSVFATWFLKVTLDQLEFMTQLFDLDTLAKRIERLVTRQEKFAPEAVYLLLEALRRGEFERGEAARLTGMPERSARRVLKDLTEAGLLASSTEKGPVSLRFPSHTLETLFPKLYPDAMV